VNIGIEGDTPTAAEAERLDGPVHLWFGLTYSNYLVLPRTLLQSMPVEWQTAFTDLLDELTVAFAHVDQTEFYDVTAGYETEDENGDPEFAPYTTGDPIPHYNRGRTFLRPALAAASTPPLQPDGATPTT
jgi:hypothetical protein